MTQSHKKITRSHDRKVRKARSQRERFFLHGQRWRFPAGLSATELDTRIAGLRMVWQEHERFASRLCFVDPNRDIELTRFPADYFAAWDLVQTGVASPATHNNETDETRDDSDWQPTQQAYLASLGRQLIRDQTLGRVRFETQPAQWSPLSIWVAEQIRQGTRPVYLPGMKTMFDSICRGPLVEVRFLAWVRSLFQCRVNWPTESTVLTSIDGLSLPDDPTWLLWEQAVALQQLLGSIYTSIPWALHPRQSQSAIQHHNLVIQRSATLINQVSGRTEPAAEVKVIPGTLHEAIDEYIKKRTEHFTVDGQFNGSGHHMIGLMESVRSRQPDMSLSLLDFGRCQEIVDFWRDRPLNLRTGKPLSDRHCSSHVGELGRFFRWLHKTPKFQWRRPGDFELIEKSIKRLPSDRRSITNLELKVFNQEHLRLLYKHGTLFERLILVWCLNCSHGAAEMGRVSWEDLYLEQPHPWASEGLDVQSDQTDSWCGLLRPKTDVVGWWWLWPETLELVRSWRKELERKLKRPLAGTERMMLSETGSPLYRDSSRNAQTAFANAWTRLRQRVTAAEGKDALPRLPFGTLRNQLSNWLGSDENQAVLASVALAHGIPHKGDKLLYRHYSNRPWSQFFQAQRKFRELHLTMFETLRQDIN